VIRSGLLGRLAEAVFFGVLPLVAVWVVARNSENYRPLLLAAILLSLVLFVSFMTHTSAVVSDTEIKVRKGRIRRSDVGRVTAPVEAPALVFRDADDRILRIVNLTETHVVMMREALRKHGWPQVELER
jgi:hypothetical protein